MPATAFSLAINNNMASDKARDILELKSGAPDLDERLGALFAADPGLAARVLACVALPGIGRRSGLEEADLLPLCGLRCIQQVVAGLLLEDAGADATNAGILGAIAAQAVAARVPVVKSEEVFLSAWLGSTPAWRQAPDSWGPLPEVRAALDKHAQLPNEAQINGARADLIAQSVRLGELLAGLASPYSEAGSIEAVQRAARLGIPPRELVAVCADIEKHAAEWSKFLGRPLKAELRINLDAPGPVPVVRFATELAEVYRYLLQNAAIDAESGLPNARYFRTRLESEWAAARRRNSALSVIAVLCARDIVRAAHVLRETARMQDVVCRSGDGEFTMICVDTHEEYASRAAQRLSAAMAEQGISASFGAATLDSMISGVDDLIGRAREAAAAARAEGAGYKVWQAS
jgi:GGDEF domain-containing protein